MFSDDKKNKNRIYWKKTLIWTFSLTVIMESSYFLFLKMLVPITFKIIALVFLVLFLFVGMLVAVVQSLNEQFIDFKKSTTKGKIAIAITFIIATIFLALKINDVFAKYK